MFLSHCGFSMRPVPSDASAWGVGGGRGLFMFSVLLRLVTHFLNYTLVIVTHSLTILQKLFFIYLKYVPP